MIVRNLLLALTTLGFVGVLGAEEGVNFASNASSESEPVTLACAVDTGCFENSGVCTHRRDCGCGNCGFRFEGWLDGGFMLNGDKSPSGYNGPYNQLDRHEGALNQAYMILERPLADSPSMSLGGRVDLLYGTDFFLGQSAGLEWNPDGSSRWNGDHYGLAIPQAYGEIGNDRLSVKVGHFYTIVGYEGVPAVNNFFYSKSLSYMFGGPFVHWGALATWKANDRLSFDAGIVNGWNALDRVSDEASFLGRVSLGDDRDPIWLSFAIITGDELNETKADSTNRTRYSFIVGTNLTTRWQYLFHQWYGTQDDFFAATGESAEWYGIDQYLYYEVSPCVRLGGRFEWFRDDDGVRLGLSRPGNPNKGPYVGDMYSLSLGVNWSPYQNLMLRPEVRWDWFDGAGLPFDDGADDRQFLVCMYAILRF